MIKSIKIMLIPNNKQRTKLFQYAGASRFAYNWALTIKKENYTSGGKFISDNYLRKEFTKFKKQQGNEWLNNISNNVTKQAIKDACESYKRFLKGYSNFPKFKSKKKSKLGFYQDNGNIKFSETHVKVEGFSESKKPNKQKLNWIKLSEYNRVDVNGKYYNPRIVYDGINWFISIGIECEENTKYPNNKGIGIDLGIKDLAICSDGNIYENINKTKNIKKLEKKKRMLQRKISKKYIKNKEGSIYFKTKNIIKSEKQLLKLNHKLTNIRNQYQYDVINDIMDRKPMFITIEDLNIRGMIKNRCLSKAIYQQGLYKFNRKLTYKSKWNNVELRQVERFYPSSKLCNVCGFKNILLKLSDREWVCKECGTTHDRDNNASKNLRDCTKYKIIA